MYGSGYTKNITTEGYLCFVMGIEHAQQNCFDVLNSTEGPWIFILPNQNIDKEFFKSWIDEYNVLSLIIISDAPVDSSSIFLKPSIISVIGEELAFKIQTMVSENHNGLFKIRLEHDYIAYCQNPNEITFINVMGELTIIYLGLSVAWFYHTFRVHKHDSTCLQHGIITITLLKMLLCMIEGIYVSQCPWIDQIQARYILMALVTISTIYQTVNIAIIILISKGWLYVRSVLTKDDLSWLTMFMGLFYLTYSAMFVTANIPRMQLFIKIWMNCLYAIIFLYTFYQCV